MLTAQQLENRKAGLGGSDTATILGLNPYKSSYQLWLEKTGRSEPEDISNKFAVKRGNDMESLVAKWFTDETGMIVRRDNRTITNDDFPFMLGHIDRRIQGKPEGLECKTANWRVAMTFGEEGTDDVPANYLIQCMHYMAVTGWRVWHLAADLGGDFRIYRIEYDEALIAHIAKTVAEWWERHIIDDEPPALETDNDLKIAYPNGDKEKLIEASPAIAGVHSELKTVVEDFNKMKERKSALENQLKAAIGDGGGLTFDGKKLATWNNQTRKSFNSKAFKSDHPETFEQYQTESSFRVFRPNFK